MFCKRFGTLRGLPKTAKLSFLSYDLTAVVEPVRIGLKRTRSIERRVNTAVECEGVVVPAGVHPSPGDLSVVDDCERPGL